LTDYTPKITLTYQCRNCGAKMEFETVGTNCKVICKCEREYELKMGLYRTK